MLLCTTITLWPEGNPSWETTKVHSEEQLSDCTGNSNWHIWLLQQKYSYYIKGNIVTDIQTTTSPPHFWKGASQSERNRYSHATCDGSGRCKVRHDEDAADTIYNKKSTRTCQMPCPTGLCRVQYGMFCTRISRILPCTRVNPSRTNISFSGSQSGCYTRLWTPLNFCVMWCGLASQYLQEVLYTTDTILIPAKIWCHHLGRNHRWIYNKKVRNTELSRCSLLNWFSSRNTSTFIRGCVLKHARVHTVSV
jgi:hypothetical protein